MSIGEGFSLACRSLLRPTLRTFIGLACISALLGLVSTARAGSVTLEWNAPNANTDGSPLLDLAGYRLYSGCVAPSQYELTPVVVGPSETSRVITGLPDDRTCYFAATAFNSAGRESPLSNEANKTFAQGVPPGQPSLGIAWDEAEQVAIAFVQRAEGGGTGASITVNISAAGAGNLLVSCMFTRGSTITNPTGFTLAKEQLNATEVDILRIVYMVATGGETSVVWTGNTDGEDTVVAVYEFSGTATSTPKDADASTGRTASASTISSGTTAALAQNDEVSVACAGLRGLMTSPSWDAGYDTPGGDVPGGSELVTLLDTYKIVSDGAAQQTDASWTTSLTAMAAIATFKAAGGAAAALSIAPLVQNYRNMGLMQ